MKKLITTTALLFLTACRYPSASIFIPTVPTDVVSLLFSSTSRDIGGGTTVTDTVLSSGFIVRKTCTAANTYKFTSPFNGVEYCTNSIYQRTVTCVVAVSEDTVVRTTGQLIAQQRYVDPPCWINRLLILPGETIDTTSATWNYEWSEFDLQGNPLYPAKGTLTDGTSLSLSYDGSFSTLTEKYSTVTDEYCGVGSYDYSGLKLVTQSDHACLIVK